MKIVVDAWLERKDPQIRFLDGDTTAPIMQWGTPFIRHLLEQGELNLEELQCRANGGLDALYEFLSAIQGDRDQFQHGWPK